MTENGAVLEVRPKFPVPHNLMFLLRYRALPSGIAAKLDAHERSSAEEEALKMVEHTLTAMACGGIFDHIGGWVFPVFHRRKMDDSTF